MTTPGRRRVIAPKRRGRKPWRSASAPTACPTGAPSEPTLSNANATLSFSNSSTIILSNVQGVISGNLYVKGLSSQTTAHIDLLNSYVDKDDEKSHIRYKPKVSKFKQFITKIKNKL